MNRSVRSTLRLRLAIAFAAASFLAPLSGCWSVATQVVERDVREWTTPQVDTERALVRHHNNVQQDGEQWLLDLSFEVGDLCVDHEYHEYHEVQEIDREPNGRAAAIPLVIGIITSIVTPLAVYNASNQETDPLGRPVDPPAPEDLGIATGIGLGVGGGFILSGIGVIDVTKRGAGHHERLLSTREEDLGEVGKPVPCNWRVLDGGSGGISAGGQRLAFSVSASDGRAIVALPPPSAEAGFEWEVEVAGFPTPDPVVLRDSAYDREARRLRATALLDDGELDAAAKVLGTMDAGWAGYDLLQDRFRVALHRQVEEALEAGEPTVALSLARSGVGILDEEETTPLLTRSLEAACRDALQRADWEGVRIAATRLAGLGESALEGEVRDAHETRLRELLGGDLEQAGVFARESGDFMGAAWQASADERLVLGQVRVQVDEATQGTNASGDQTPAKGPQSTVALVVEAARSIEQRRRSSPPEYPTGASDAMDELTQMAQELLDVGKLKKTYAPWWKASGNDKLPSRVAGLLREVEWLTAFDAARPVFGSRREFADLGSKADRMRDRLAAFAREVDAFEAFAGDFAAAAVNAELARTAPLSVRDRIGGREASYRACRQGKSFVTDFSPTSYRELATMYCSTNFPSDWTFGEGTSYEHTTSVSVRACEQFFREPAGCR